MTAHGPSWGEKSAEERNPLLPILVERKRSLKDLSLSPNPLTFDQLLSPAPPFAPALIQRSLCTSPALSLHISSTLSAHLQHSLCTSPALSLHISSTLSAHLQHSLCTSPALPSPALPTMPYGEAFNSSDVNLPPRRDEDDDANIGKRALTRIIQGSVQDRINSKIAVRTLTDAAQASGTIYQRKYWYKLFCGFGESTLGLGSRQK